MIIFIGPYFYYSILINKTAAEHPKEGYRFSHISDFWMSGVGAVLSVAIKKFLPPLFKPVFSKYVKEGDLEY